MTGVAPAFSVCTTQEEASQCAGESRTRVLILPLPLANCINVDRAFLSFVSPIYKSGIIVLLRKVGVIINEMKYSSWNTESTLQVASTLSSSPSWEQSSK